jgi:tRNA pseudouridine32 synthase / 23S rRNA pseudouridine746 synthase
VKLSRQKQWQARRDRPDRGSVDDYRLGSPPPLMTPAPAILFQDQRFVVLDKPAGLPVHPGPRGGPSVEDWFPLLSRRDNGPWLAHRLDADTTGCLIIALRKAALLAAQREFTAGRARKTYWAVVSGRPDQDAGTISAALRRQNTSAGWWMRWASSGTPAVTDWRVLGHGPDRTWIEFRPRTGRTHQLRVHSVMLGCPVLGDPLYGDGAGRLHLLSRHVELDLDPPLSATAEPPLHMREALHSCGWQPSIVPLIDPDRKIS